MTIAAALVVAGLLAPFAISNGHHTAEATIAADQASEELAPRDIELASSVDRVEAAGPTAAAPIPRQPVRANSPEPRTDAPNRAGSPERARGPVDGGLSVETTPPGARVTVNGIGYGETPLKIGYLPFGTKRVRIIKEGYASVERTVRIDAGSPRPRLRVPLREQHD